MLTFIVVISALLLDFILGEPRRYHPLVLFGTWVEWLEKRLNTPNNKRAKGIVAVLLAIVPLTALVVIFEKTLLESIIFQTLFECFILYIAIGWHSLVDHAKNIAKPLQANDIAQARQAVSFIVSRDTSQLDEEGISKAAVESVLENGADAVFAPIFWFCIAGIPGVFIYRLANTLDAMWGYKNERFLAFGWCAARLDDVLNYIPARLVALSYALAGQTKHGFNSWFQQGHQWDSPNAGPVMAAGAGALNVTLGGAATYGEDTHQRITLGVTAKQGGKKANASLIYSACTLLTKSLAVWLVALMLIAILQELL
ncbi:MAG: cobalamin biosynthesis protein [Cycloclasticus sp. symbiont of Bathymodiolus heckerae]|nr:MAG: cobalamin biosynthesis protein [Cycloclasticus sp. symbiont of Bathymodiolus heckerae]